MGERRGTKALETWCRRVTQGYPGVKVENMTTSWRDGLAFCAMIHHFRPDLIDFSRLDKSDIYGNNELAFRIAERHLGIPALLDAEDMAEYPVPDRLSILTYLSQFYQAFASNSASPIKKATSDSPDSSIVSLVQGNVQKSTKMEEGSSLRWREPCVVCNNPVFIAQKLRIDGKLYHRTCFRCARCNNQLSVADYYETHDGQYCCETCPDEVIMEAEKQNQFINNNSNKKKKDIENVNDDDDDEIIVDNIEKIINEEEADKEIVDKSLLPPEPPPPLPPSSPPPLLTTNPPISVVCKDPDKTLIITSSSSNNYTINTPISTEEERPSASLVAIRRMMFDNYNKETDDAKLINNKKDLLLNKVESSSQKIKPSSDEEYVNNTNVKSSFSNNNNNNKNNIHKSNKDVNIINNKTSTTSQDGHQQFSEMIITERTEINNDNIISNTVKDESVNNLIDNVYKSGIDKNLLPLSTCSDYSNDKDDNDGDVDKNTIISTEDIVSIQGNSSSISKEEKDIVENVVKTTPEVFTEDNDNVDTINNKLLLADDTDKSTSAFIQTEEEKVIIIEDSVNIDSITTTEEKHEVVNNKEETKQEDQNTTSITSRPTIKVENVEEYPDDLNPFGDDDEDEDIPAVMNTSKSTNPFGSDSENEEDDQQHPVTNTTGKVSSTISPTTGGVVRPSLGQVQSSNLQKSPSLNPFDSDDDDDDDDEMTKKPVPLPRKSVHTPEPVPFPRSRLRGSLRSINSLSSTCSLPSPRKKKLAPQPPSSPSSTLSRSPRPRKNRRAPLPPSSSTFSVPDGRTDKELDTSLSPPASLLPPLPAGGGEVRIDKSEEVTTEQSSVDIAKEISNVVGLISDLASPKKDDDDVGKDNFEDDVKLAVPTTAVVATADDEDDEQTKKTEDVGNQKKSEEICLRNNNNKPSSLSTLTTTTTSTPIRRRNSLQSEEQFIIGKEIVSGPRSLNESFGDISSANVSFISDNTSLNNSFSDSLASPLSEKKNKDSANMHRKISDGGSVYLSKSTHGQWRRKKAPAPPLPLPKRRPVQPMPMQNIRQELHDIEIKQQGLERQGVALENKIRDKFDSESTITPYVEELVLQLFELVNEKNELFRKQAELMYLRRQHHLEEEHSELEYQIRCLMARPEANKTDSDKELEEQLIQRLVEVVERRDAIVQCLEMDRLREAEEDRSINTQLGIFTLAMAKEVKLTTKKKHKKTKDKHNVIKMMDLDKDLDDSDEKESSKKKKKWFTLHHIKGGKHL